MPRTYEILSAFADKDTSLYVIASALEDAGWTITSVQGAGEFTRSIEFDVQAFFAPLWQFHSVSADGGLTGWVLIPEEADYLAFTPSPGWTKILLGDHNTSTAKAKILEFFTMNPLNGIWYPGNETLISSGTTETSAIEFTYSGATGTFFQVNNLDYNVWAATIRIGAALRCGWNASKGGGYICQSAALGDSSNFITLYISEGDGGGAGTFNKVYATKSIPGRTPHPYYVKPSNSSLNGNLTGWIVASTIYCSPYNFFFLDNAISYSGGRPMTFASVLYPPESNILKSGIVLNQGFTLGGHLGWRSNLTGVSGMWAVYGDTYYIGDNDTYIGHLLRPSGFTNIEKHWDVPAVECLEAFLFMKYGSEAWKLMGLMNDILVSHKNYSIDEIINFDTQEWVPFTRNNLNSLIVAIN